jgi:hypothetical protein
MNESSAVSSDTSVYSSNRHAPLKAYAMFSNCDRASAVHDAQTSGGDI